MLKKLLFIGLGISIIVVKKSYSYLKEKKEVAGEQINAMVDAEAAVPEPKEAKQAGFSDIATIEVLDVGCYTGQWLRMLLEWGANPSKLHGVDLLEESIAKAKVLSPAGVDFRVSNGWPLPYQDASMDVCAASTVFSSILSPSPMRALY